MWRQLVLGFAARYSKWAGAEVRDSWADDEVAATADRSLCLLLTDKTYITDWRHCFYRFCVAVMCDNGQMYDSCGSPTEPSCDNLYSGYTPAVRNGLAVEGCYCPPGTVRNGKYSRLDHYVYFQLSVKALIITACSLFSFSNTSTRQWMSQTEKNKPYEIKNTKINLQ